MDVITKEKVEELEEEAESLRNTVELLKGDLEKIANIAHDLNETLRFAGASPCPLCGGARVAGYKGSVLRWKCRSCKATGWVRRGEH